MNPVHVDINWQNDTAPAINQTNLGQINNELSTYDSRIVTFDTTKANQSDLLKAFKDVSLNTTTGVITFTLFDNTTKTIDTLLEKVAINFDYDDNPSSAHYQNLIIELEDGTYKYIDMSALITEYEFTTTDTIAFTVGQDGAVSANVRDGSITGAKLQPNYLADVTAQANTASAAATSANADQLKAEGFANGTQGGVPVSSGSPYYENNAKYWKEQAQAIAGQTLGGLTDVTITTPTDGQSLIYDGNSGEWVNKTISTGRTPNDITSRLSDLPTAVSEQNLEKYGYKIGDYFERTDGARTYRYWLADMDTFYGGYNERSIVDTHHIGLVVDTKATSTWNDSLGNPNYGNSTLQNYLSGTVLNNIKSDMIALFGGSTGLEHLLKHDKRFATTGSSSWFTDQYISALTEVQVCGSRIQSADSEQQGEGTKELELFSLFKYNKVFGQIDVWFRSQSGSQQACSGYSNGIIYPNYVTSSFRAAGLILFH